VVYEVGGLLLLVTATTAAGNVVAASYGARSRQIGQLRLALHLLESEVVYALGALPGALDRVAAGVSGPVKDIFGQAAALLRSGEGMSAGEAWEKAAWTVFPRSALVLGDLEVILALSGYLGVTDREDQRRHLGLAVERLRAREEEAAADQRTSERMWRYLGPLGGLALGIVLL
jgi:stage III sporulation protein AB